MSAFVPMTEAQAIAKAREQGLTHIAVARFADGVRASPCRDYMEAVRWLNMQRDYFYAGSESIKLA